MTDTDRDRQARVDRLRRARQADSATKAERAQRAVADLLRSGHRVSFTRVASQANVSTWFLYNNPTVKDAVREAMTDQVTQGITAAAVAPRQRATPASLHTDLALAREEIKDLKKERDALQHRVRLALGAQIDNVAQTELVQRIQDLERQNQALARDLAASTRRSDELTKQLEDAEDTVASLRLALRKAIRAVP